MRWSEPAGECAGFRWGEEGRTNPKGGKTSCSPVWAQWDVAQELPRPGTCLASRGWAELPFSLPVLITSRGRAGSGFLDNHTLPACPVQHREGWALLDWHGWIMNTVLEMFRLRSYTPCKSLKALVMLLLYYKNSPKDTPDDSPDEISELFCIVEENLAALSWQDFLAHTQAVFHTFGFG